jgi:hypothetical protein
VCLWSGRGWIWKDNSVVKILSLTGKRHRFWEMFNERHPIMSILLN